MVIRGVSLACFCSVAALMAAGQEPSPGPSGQIYGTGTAAVVVDVVVRDRKGNPVTDLRKEDFELLEDGVRQEIAAFEVVATPQSSTTTPVATPPPGRPPETVGTEARTTVATPTFVAIVFDRLSPEARALAHRGALAYLEAAHEDEFAGVFLSDLSLVTIQTFTSDRRLLRAALDEAASRATSVFDRQADRILTHLGDPHPATPPTASAEHQGPPDPVTKERLRQLPPDYRGSDPELAFAAMAMRMERAFEVLVRDAQGYATTNALLALMEGLGGLPGRKTIVFFAEGLSIPPAVQARFASVIATANRHNVSVYTVDAAGLRVHSKAAEAGRQVRELGAAGVSDAQRGSAIWLKDLELNEDILRQDPAVSLRVLAERTGGFLIDNTNDLARDFRDIDADRRFHYLLTYTPANDQFTGEWRTIAVRVPGRRVQVRARTGYQALRNPGIIPLLAWEAPAAALLERASPPRDIPVRLGVLTFPASGDESVVPVLVSVPAERVAFDVSDEGFRTDFTILTRVRDAGGEVVRKGSQPYRLAGPRDRLDVTRAGEVLFYRQPTLPPGDYTLEVAVLDTFARRGTVERRPFRVAPAAAGSLRASDLVVVKGAERVRPDEQQAGHPLYVGDLLVYPNLGEPVTRGAGAISLFAEIRLAAAGTLAAHLEVDGPEGPLAPVPVTLADADAAGRIQQLLQVPLANLSAGEYVFRLAVQQGTAHLVREAHVRVVD